MQERSPQGVLPLAEAWKLLRCEKHWSAAKQPELQQSDERSVLNVNSLSFENSKRAWRKTDAPRRRLLHHRPTRHPRNTPPAWWGVMAGRRWRR